MAAAGLCPAAARGPRAATASCLSSASASNLRSASASGLRTASASKLRTASTSGLRTRSVSSLLRTSASGLSVASASNPRATSASVLRTDSLLNTNTCSSLSGPRTTSGCGLSPTSTSHTRTASAISFSTAASSSSHPGIRVRSPRDGAQLSLLPDTSAEQVNAAVLRASDCFQSCWAQPAAVDDRAAVLRKIAEALRARMEPLARLETLDCGKPLRESREDMMSCASLCDFYAGVAATLMREQELRLPTPPFTSRIVPSAAGVVACISPWNYPLMQAVLKVAPAMAAGCSVILKPSPLASLSCLQLADIAAAAGAPEGALTVITGGAPGGSGEGSERLLSHPLVDRLSFTGSGATGRKLLRACAEQLRPAALELGGKSAMIVFEDADVEAVVSWAKVGIFSCAGQICSATSRLLLHSSVAPAVIRALVEAAVAIRVGDPLDEATDMGPLISAEQQHKVLSAVASARAEGCSVLCGGGALQLPGLEGGFYVEPTILSDPTRRSSAWREEIFGPVLTLSTFEAEAEAVAAANDSPYGLAHAVMSADEARCARVARRLEAGTVWINCSQPVWPETPFGGWKQSGFGREWGEAGMHEYLRHKTVTAAPHRTSPAALS